MACSWRLEVILFLSFKVQQKQTHRTSHINNALKQQIAKQTRRKWRTRKHLQDCDALDQFEKLNLSCR